MLVKLPSFSVCAAAGRKNTSVPMSSVRNSPDSISGPSFHQVALSMSEKSRTTSQSRWAIPRRCILRVGRADRRVLPHEEVAATGAVQLPEHRLVGAVVPGESRQVVEAEVVVGGGGITEVRLQQADGVRLDLGPEALDLRVVAEERGQVLVVMGHRHGEVPGQQVEQRRDVGRALDRRVAAQGEDAAAGAADVAEEGLEDRRGADVLHPHRVLRPSDRVGEGRRAIAAPSSR